MSGRDLNKRQVETLIKAGAFDSLGIARRRIMTVYERIVDGVNQQGRSNLEGQLDMFSSVPEVANTFKYEYPDLPEYSPRELLNFEKEVSGMYFSGHILDGYSKNIANIAHVKIQKLHADEEGDLPVDGSRVTVCGIIGNVTQKTTKNGDRMAFITLEDDSGEIECVVFPKVYEKVSHMLRIDNCIALNGNVQLRDEDSKILASGISELVENAKYTEPEKPKATSQPATNTGRVKKLFLRLPDLECEQALKAKNLVEIFEGNTAVMLYNSQNKQYVAFGGADITPFLMSELKKLLGDENVVYG